MSGLLTSIKSALNGPRLEKLLSFASIYNSFSAVKSHRLGLSLTMHEKKVSNIMSLEPVRHMGELEKHSVGEIIEWTESDHALERSLGMAALNSCIPLSFDNYYEGNAFEFIEKISAGKNVSIIGHFPHLEKIRQTAQNMWIIEKNPSEGDLPAEAASYIIPQSDIVACTGVTFLNHTIEELLSLKKPGAIFVMLGPTVPLSPVLFDFGIDIIGSTWVEDERKVISMLSHGAIFRVLSGVRYILMPRNANLMEGFTKISPPDFI